MLDQISTLPLYIQVAIFSFVGLLVGSFLNVVILRLPRHTFWEWTEQCKTWLKEGTTLDTKPPSIITSVSHCPKCKSPIKPWHNIPLISYIFLLRGKCNSCGTSISPRYPFIELLSSILSGLIFWKFGLTIETVLALIFTWVLIVHTFIDLDHQLLLDEITYPILWLGLVASVFATFTDSKSAIIGGALGYLSLWSIFHIFKIMTKKEGMGYGDFKLLALLGAWLGWQYLLQIIVVSTLLGSIVGICLILFKKAPKDKALPFGPYLAVAGWIALMYGDLINANYLKFFTL